MKCNSSLQIGTREYKNQTENLLKEFDLYIACVENVNFGERHILLIMTVYDKNIEIQTPYILGSHAPKN